MSDPLSPNSSDELAPLRQAEAAEPRSRSRLISGRSGRFWGLALLVIVALVYFNSTRGSPVFNSKRTSSVPSTITWTDDLPAALARAKETHQAVLLKFSAVWCAPCKVMQRQVFSRKDVAGALAKWITVSIDADKHRSSVSNYKVEVYPTFILLNSDGNEVLRYEGALPAEEFIRLIQDQKVSFPSLSGERLDVFPDSQPWRLSPTSAPVSMLLPRLPLSEDEPADPKRNPIDPQADNNILSPQYLACPSEAAAWEYGDLT